MNDIQKELVNVAGDVTVSKESVKKHVLQQPTNRKNLYDSRY